MCLNLEKIIKRKGEYDMAFVYEEVGEKNRELWNLIGLKNWAKEPMLFSKTRYWAIDKEKCEYLVAIGGYIDMPNYYDFSYDGKIVRMEVFCLGEGNRKEGAVFNWKIKKMYIPKSLWNQKDEVVQEVISAFSVFINAFPRERVKAVNVEIKCEPECVEVDYNGR